MCVCVCVCVVTLPSVWALSSWTRDITRAKAVKASSPNHPPAREFLQRTCFDVQQVGSPGAGFCGRPLERCLCRELTSRGRQKQMNGRQGRGPKSHKKARFIHLPGPQAIKDPSLPSRSTPSQASHLPWSPERPQGHTEARPPVLRAALQLGTQVGGAGGAGWDLNLVVCGGPGPCWAPPAHAVQRGPGRTLPGLQRGRAELCREPGSRGPRALVPSASWAWA